MIPSISTNELLNIIDQINLIDIRSVQKYNDNHIPGAKNIQPNQLIVNPSKYLDYAHSYYIYCQKGITSYKICKILKTKGYKVININGGYESWLLEK